MLLLFSVDKLTLQKENGGRLSTSVTPGAGAWLTCFAVEAATGFGR